MKKNISKDYEKMKVSHSNAAGIDVGSRSHFVAIGEQRDEVTEFGCYTHELHDLCRWLKDNGVTTVALV